MCGLIRRVSFGVRQRVRRLHNPPGRNAVDAAGASAESRNPSERGEPVTTIDLYAHLAQQTANGRCVKMLCRKAALAALGAYAFAWGVAHPKATEDERIKECVRMTLWAYARGWL